MITFLCAEGLKRAFVIRVYECGHRFRVRCADGSTYIIDLSQIQGTRKLRMKS